MTVNWEVSFFQGVALEMWRRAMTPEQTRAEAEFLEQRLKASRPSDLLDVPCGNGRHSIELARRGHRVVGVDKSEEFILEARNASADLAAKWVLGDMQILPWQNFFDGVFCFGNSFGYLNAEQAAAFLRTVAGTLRAGGRFAMETGMAAESILPTRQKTRWFKLGDLYMLSENEYDVAESRLDIQYTFIQGGKEEVRPSSSYVLTVNQMCRMHTEVGLKPLELLGSIQGEAYQFGSPRLIMVSEKQ